MLSAPCDHSCARYALHKAHMHSSMCQEPAIVHCQGFMGKHCRNVVPHAGSSPQLHAARPGRWQLFIFDVMQPPISVPGPC